MFTLPIYQLQTLNMLPALRRIHIFAVLALSGLYLLTSSIALADNDLAYQLKYRLEFLPGTDQALVNITLDNNGKLIRSLSFQNLPGLYTEIQANGDLSVTETDVRWVPPKAKATLSLKVKVTRERNPGEFGAMMTKEWALFRGDDIFPAVKADFVDGAHAVATLDVILPPNWTSIETGWPRIKGNTFRIDNPNRKFDRPTGWMIAGTLGTRRAKVSKTAISVSAPKGSQMRRMDVLTFFKFVWPELNQAFEKTPRKLLIVGMGDPMWRGGLSASNSLFLHADRPVVSENGTSPLLHELTHMITRIHGVKTAQTNDDWIAEGLAEFYSFELLYRAGGMSKERRKNIIKKLSKWGKNVKHLRSQQSTGAFTARAVVLLDELDREIRRRSKNKASIDNVTRDLMAKRTVSLDDLKQSVEALIGPDAETLRSPLLK